MLPRLFEVRCGFRRQAAARLSERQVSMYDDFDAYAINARRHIR